MPAIAIAREPERVLTLVQELDLARRAHARTDRPLLRRRLVDLAFRDDDFATVIALVEADPQPGHTDLVRLTHALLALQTDAANARARVAAERALARAEDSAQAAAALADLAKAHVRLGEPLAARAALDRALQLDPYNKNACKRLAALDLREGRAVELAAWSADLLAKGVNHARLFAARVLGEAASGHTAAAQAIDGMAALARYETLDPPPGFADLAGFNAALAQELLAHPGQRHDRYGSASNLTLRVEDPARPDAPMVRALLDGIVARVQARLAEERGDHPWQHARPPRALLRAWCVITDGKGYEGWHVHQYGWLSGVYYVEVPDTIAHGDDAAGCLQFGLPPEQVGEAVASAYGTRLVRPHAGLLMTFPSHNHHRTFAHGAAGQRICLAFDLRPL